MSTKTEVLLQKSYIFNRFIRMRGVSEDEAMSLLLDTLKLYLETGRRQGWDKAREHSFCDLDTGLGQVTNISAKVCQAVEFEHVEWD